jgi:Carboxypeptidase regulatory-like domain/TonB-dependent Receptor Plug Domain
MNTLSKKVLCAAAAALLLLVGAQAGFGQNATTGTITGVVMDAQRGVLPGATVTAVHTPTGTTYEAITQSDGHFTMNAVRVGGPYTIKVTMSGFKEAEQKDITVALGEVRAVDFTLNLATVTETVNVVAQAQVIDTERAGTAANIASQTIEALPTINRSINDFARTSPYFNVTSDSAGGSEFVSVAGRNNRYNNMQIDGAVNNDVFGLAATGTPGGQTNTQPISLDAIQEIQLLVSPYDVRQGGFSGGGINAVTKSGTNAFHGGGYYVGRNQNLIGQIPAIATTANPNPADTKVGTFTDKQFGFTLGGPVFTNKMFFFANVDWARKNTPVGYSADGSSGQQFGTQALVQQVVDIAKSKYGYDPGGLGEVSKPNNSNKIFGRVDFNLGANHQLTIRENYVDALADVGSSSNFSYTMPSNYYHMTDKMLSSVGQLNSSFGRLFNEFRVTYQRERNVRGGPPGSATFPQVRVYMSDGNSVYFGTEYSSQANALNQDIVQLSDDVTYVRGRHTFSFGTQNEFYKFYNVFIQYLDGGYTFSNVTNFTNGIAQSYNHNFSNDPSNPLQPALFSVQQVGFYAGDKWRMASNFTLTYGARIDVPHFPDTPHNNPLSITDFGYSTTAVPAPVMFSPRVGFNWDLSKGAAIARRQIRGGVGLFTGRTPYVWLSNQYSNTGVDFTSLSVSYNTSVQVPFVADPNNQPTTVTGGSTGRQTINLIDPNYKFPEVIRGNLALDYDLPFGLVGTAEFLYTKTVEDIAYTDINYIPNTTLPTGQVTVKKFDNNLNDVLLLSNTSLGRSWTSTFSVERPYRHGFYFKASYLYGRTYSLNDGTSSVALSNFRNNPYTYYANTPQMSRGNFDPGHRINVAASIDLPRTFNLSHQFSLFYNGMTGRRYSQGWYNDVNGDGGYNDLLWVPSDPSQVLLTGGTWAQLDSYLSSDACTSQYRGMIAPRNCARAPWQNQMDIQYALNIPTGHKTKAEITVTIFNFLNLVNKNWGWQYWGSFPMDELFTYGGVDAATGKIKYTMSTITSSTFLGTFNRDDLRSRWQMQIGARFRF